MLRSTVALLLLTIGLNAQFFEKHQPSSKKTLKVFNYTYFVVGYSDQTRTPAWTAFEINKPSDPILTCERSGRFAPEPQEDPVIVHKDYASSGYSRGHMVPNAAMAYWQGCDANKATFITSNIVPQLQRNNAGVWEALESAIAGKKGGNENGFSKGLIGRSQHVWVFAGPVFWGQSSEITKISAKEIWVPTAIWKTVIWVDPKTHENKTCSWIIPHQADIPRNAYMDYVVSIKDVFEKTGINVLSSNRHPLYTRCDVHDFISVLE